MITRCKHPPFEVRLKTREGDREITGFSGEFFSPEEGDAPGIAENQDIFLLFRAPSDFRLTMDGLDVVRVPGAEHGEDGTRLPPQDRYVPLFEAKNFPLVPGYYVITVSGRGKKWYSAVEILPRYLEKQQWQDMAGELMGEIRRLSFDFMKRTMRIDRPLENALGLSGSMLLRFYIVSDMSDRVMHVMAELSRTANSRITLRACREPADRERKEEIHGRPSRGKERGLPYRETFRAETTFDVPENRFAKTVLLLLEKSLRQFVRTIDENAARVGAEQEEFRKYKKDYQYRMRGTALERFTDYRNQAQKLLAAIRQISSAPWFEEAKTLRRLTPGHAAARDPRYAVLYRLHRRLMRPEESLSVSSFYRFQWKRTDKLYELWCFLTFVKAFGKKDWQMEAGPAVREDGGRYLLESLEAGTVIRMTRGDEEIHLVYDALIPATAADTDRENAPLYTNNTHRRPDMRVDYYRGKEYCGSLVADFKYRDIYKIWSDAANNPEIRAQFNAYRDMNTKFYRGMEEMESIRNSRPVKEVWAVFPRETPPRSDEDYSLRFISLAPGLSANETLPELLETCVKELSGEIET